MFLSAIPIEWQAHSKTDATNIRAIGTKFMTLQNVQVVAGDIQKPFSSRLFSIRRAKAVVAPLICRLESIGSSITSLSQNP